MTSPPGAAARRRRPVAVPIAVLVAAAGLGITAALGGLGEAPDDPPRRLGPGAVLDQGEFTTRFVESRTTVRPGRYGGPDKRYLEVVFRVTNKGDETTGVGAPGQGGKPGYLFAGSLLRMTPELGGDFGPDVFVEGDGVPGRQLHPGMESTVVVRYELPEGRRAPERVLLDVGAFEHPEGFTQDIGWLLVKKDDDGPPAVAAQVTLPVRKAAG
ncbi:hypothetical protein ACFYSC_17410 [Streptosporangium sp. NPDC004379]|uniref:hypothetical protein n=1 Tax=Streptosporangium sp. NPDC004379 TaxID=3366189 RepID=UPI00369E82E4